MEANNELISKAFVAKEIFGIDPGKSNGGIVKYNYDRYESWPLKKMVEFEDMVDYFKYQAEICELPLVFIEKINTYTGDYQNNGNNANYVGRAFQMDKLKRHYTELISALKTSKMRFIPVMPYQWQKTLKIHISGEETPERKRRFKDIALQWYPGQKIIGWNADAFLLIKYAQMKLKYDQSYIHKKLKENEPKINSLFK